MSKETELISEIKKIYEQGDYEDVLLLIPKLKAVNKLEFYIWKVRVFLNLNSYKETLDLINSVERIFKQDHEENSVLFFRLLLEKLVLYYFNEKIKESKICLEQTEELYYQLQKISKLKTEDKLFFNLIKITSNVILNNDYIKGLKSLKELLPVVDESGSLMLRYLYNIQISYYCGLLGYTHEALKHGQLSFELSRKLNNKMLQLNSANYLGISFIAFGNYPESYRYFELGLNLCKNKFEKRFLVQKARILDNLGWLYFMYKIDTKSSMESLNKAEDIYLEMGVDQRNINFLADIYHGKILNFLFISDLKSIFFYVKKLEILSFDYESEFLIQKFKLCKALYLLKKGRIKEKAEAMLLLEDIVNLKKIYQDITFPAIVNLTSILLAEYSETKDPEILTEISSFIINLKKREGDFHARSEISILESKMMLINGKIKEAKDLLVNSLDKVKEMGFLLIQKKIEKELNRIEKDQDNWQTLLKQSSNITEKLEIADFKSYFDDIMKINPKNL